MPSVLSLFAGIGGLDLGLEAHGCETVAYSEVDPHACRVMSARFPSAVNLGDITTIDWEDAEREHGGFDIIAGGFPCQDISLAGKGAGIDGERSGLWSCYADAIRILRPGGVLVENVQQLARRGLDRVLGDLAVLGYDAEWRVLRADGFGFPHARRRLFLIAYPGGERTQVQDWWEQPAVEVAWGEGAADGYSGGFRWATESGVGGGDDGLPYWVDPGDRTGTLISPFSSHNKRGRWDRNRCLGNAVVPQVAEFAAGVLLDRMEAGNAG
jgi:DNA (cytosine-5)-methyltransferase 1